MVVRWSKTSFVYLPPGPGKWSTESLRIIEMVVRGLSILNLFISIPDDEGKRPENNINQRALFPDALGEKGSSA
ncbi:hypothetical protein [Cyclobacterium plantarum]|uniref:Uncharacterized protein n=1 Tax=Cyclobacterium plantarum TaxID=2716263 RepID=A0ABX0H736_9BACT|nr:hypothetical protein [Cyclobacterium plantarum]NHE56026.1 hypothetical protein [Cyclobacterium plantarum]